MIFNFKLVCFSYKFFKQVQLKVTRDPSNFSHTVQRYPNDQFSCHHRIAPFSLLSSQVKRFGGRKPIQSSPLCPEIKPSSSSCRSLINEFLNKTKLRGQLHVPISAAL